MMCQPETIISRPNSQANNCISLTNVLETSLW